MNWLAKAETSMEQITSLHYPTIQSALGTPTTLDAKYCVEQGPNDAISSIEQLVALDAIDPPIAVVVNKFELDLRLGVRGIAVWAFGDAVAGDDTQGLSLCSGRMRVVSSLPAQSAGKTPYRCGRRKTYEVSGSRQGSSSSKAGTRAGIVEDVTPLDR